MKCSVTVLGAPTGQSPSGAAGLIADYLHGRKADRGRPMEERKQPEPDSPEPVRPDRRPPETGSSQTASAYYGDSAECEGRWLGSGFGDTRFDGEVGREEFVELLLGTDPRTGERLIGGASSTPRTRGTRTGDPKALDGLAGDDSVGLGIASRFLGVSRAYLKERAASTTAARDAGEEPSGAWLDAAKTGKRNAWEVSVDELHRFAAGRSTSAVVLGYDVTFSCPKSVSLLWSMVDREERTQILEAIEASVGAGIAYLEANGCTVKVGGELVAGEGLLAAGYLHATSRALDPQLHWHCVVLNASVGPDGQPRALDGRGLFAHAKTAGYLAGAQLRHELTTRLGVRWEDPVNGLADIVGIDRETIEAFSKRSGEINEIAEAAGLHTANGRQAAALASRSAKTAVVAEDLIDGWHEDLFARGYGADRINDLMGHTAPGRPTDRDLRRQFALMLGPDGLTALTPVFDRRDVIQALAEWTGDRLTAIEIADLADEFCCQPQLVALEGGWSRPGAVILRRDGHAAPAAGGTAYTTLELLETEREIVDRFTNGLGAGTGLVGQGHVEVAIETRPTLGADQAAMVRAICGSGDRTQCVLGPAGSGKTFALEAAARAWEADGYRVIGAAVAGVAADVLGQSVGIETSTVASLLARNATTRRPTLDERTVLLIDEASTIGTRDLVSIVRLAERTGATVRLIGDPAQHGSVTAGGMFAHLVTSHRDHTPELTVNRRQTGEQLGEVRMALDDYRHGHIRAAIERLDNDGRITTAETADELLDVLVADWYVDRQLAQKDPSRARSAMIAEHHFERAQLNARARSMLAADGTLHGPTLDVAGQRFQAGDEVMVRQQARHLAPSDDPKAYLRNGSRGVIAAVDLSPNGEGLWVDIERGGRVLVPRAFLEAEVRQGVVGGLTHAYAMTSHAAQGETYAAGRHLATDRSSHEGVYVGLSRGKEDVHLYAVRQDQLTPNLTDDPQLPRLVPETRHARDAVAARLTTSPEERPAILHDPDAVESARLAETTPAVELSRQARHEGPGSVADRAWARRRDVIETRACLHPDPSTMQLLGTRPTPGPDRTMWERATGAFAVHRAVHPDRTTPEARQDWQAVADLIERTREFLGLDVDHALGVPPPAPELVPSPAQPTRAPGIPHMVLER